MDFRLLRGDCVEMMRTLPDCSVDSVVTDPPYGLSFMGHHWDYDVPGVDVWCEAMRVLKPGGHLLAFAGSRTYHRMAVNIEDAGFEIRDQIMWVYGSGFPKSMDVSKAIDKAAGAERDVTRDGNTKAAEFSGKFDNAPSSTRERRDNPATEAARQWQGWGTALKPAHEPIVVARKPLAEKTVAANVLAYGTGALNIDACRVETDDDLNGGRYSDNKQGGDGDTYGRGINKRSALDYLQPAGRWPANLIHDGSDEVVALFPDSNGSGGSVPNVKITGYGDKNVGTGKAEYFGGPRTKVNSGTGTAARFFYAAKASKKDRGEGNTHPTVKPVAVCEYLQRLVTPPGGVTLDMYCGSGSFGVSAMENGFSYIGIDRDADADGNALGYLEIARRRILYAQCEASGL